MADDHDWTGHHTSLAIQTNSRETASATARRMPSRRTRRLFQEISSPADSSANGYLSHSLLAMEMIPQTDAYRWPAKALGRASRTAHWSTRRSRSARYGFRRDQGTECVPRAARLHPPWRQSASGPHVLPGGPHHCRGRSLPRPEQRDDCHHHEEDDEPLRNVHREAGDPALAEYPGKERDAEEHQRESEKPHAIDHPSGRTCQFPTRHYCAVGRSPVGRSYLSIGFESR